jgi:hypothetical protein
MISDAQRNSGNNIKDKRCTAPYYVWTTGAVLARVRRAVSEVAKGRQNG